MKTTLIFLACLLVITGANLREQCNNKAVEISSQDCKQQCNENARARYPEDTWACADCIFEHQDYEEDCKGMKLEMQCFTAEDDIALEDCKEKCDVSAPSEEDDGHPWLDCIRNCHDLGLGCKNLINIGNAFPFYPATPNRRRLCEEGVVSFCDK